MDSKPAINTVHDIRYVELSKNVENRHALADKMIIENS